MTINAEANHGKEKPHVAAQFGFRLAYQHMLTKLNALIYYYKIMSMTRKSLGKYEDFCFDTH